jgi:hypothetical protein
MSLTEMRGVLSSHFRRKVVEDGFTKDVCSSVTVSSVKGRLWLGSSLQLWSERRGAVSVVSFEKGSTLERIDDSCFRWSGLRSIVIPSSVVVVGKLSFTECKSLESVTFENGST